MNCPMLLKAGGKLNIFGFAPSFWNNLGVGFGGVIGEVLVGFLVGF